MQDFYDSVAEGREILFEQFPFAEAECLQVRKIDLLASFGVEPVSERHFHVDHVLSPFRDDVSTFLLCFVVTHELDLLFEVNDSFCDFVKSFLLLVSERLSVRFLEL